MTTTAAAERGVAIAEARTWLGTPFHHGAQLKGVGVDCVHFLIACYVAAHVIASIDPGFYTPQWFCHDSGIDLERFTRGVSEHFERIPDPAPGDLLLFQYGRAESHGAIVVAPDLVIHASGPRGMVVEEEIGPGSPLEARRGSAWTPRRWTHTDRSCPLPDALPGDPADAPPGHRTTVPRRLRGIYGDIDRAAADRRDA